MPILDARDSEITEPAPGFVRTELVGRPTGAQSLTVADVTLAPGAAVDVHTHPKEEAMVILEGQAEATLGDETVTVTAGQTVLAMAGVKHGFVNRSGAPLRIMAIHPTNKVERTAVS